MFASREEAGRALGAYLENENVPGDVVLGLPRGGVVVAAEVAHVLHLPLDVVIVRKIGHPLHREFAVGALAENGVVLCDDSSFARNPILRTQLDAIIEEEQERLRAYQTRFHPGGLPSLRDKAVLLVDDGLATGATTEAAVESVRKQGASRVVVAAPVASTSAVERLCRVADEVRALLIDPDFDAVGRYYEVFTQTTDEQVSELLRAELKRVA